MTTSAVMLKSTPAECVSKLATSSRWESQSSERSDSISGMMSPLDCSTNGYLSRWAFTPIRFLRDHVMARGWKWDRTKVSPRTSSPRIAADPDTPPKKQSADVGGSPLQHPPICFGTRGAQFADGTPRLMAGRMRFRPCGSISCLPLHMPLPRPRCNAR